MKKLITALAMGAFIIATIPTTAFASHHGHSTTYAACTVEGCNATETHQHDCQYYTGHTLGDGHSYHQVCSVENCTQTGTHDHDGNTYFEHHREDGHTYHANIEHHDTTDGHRRHRRRGGHHS